MSKIFIYHMAAVDLILFLINIYGNLRLINQFAHNYVQFKRENNVHLFCSAG